MALLPSWVPQGTVTGQFDFVSTDGTDTDPNPELFAVTGTVDFTCSASPLPLKLSVPSHNYIGVVPLKFSATFDSEGYLGVLQGDGTNFVRGIELPATDSTLFNPSGFTWHVEFNLRASTTGYTVNLPAFDISVPTGGTVDLITVMPVSSANGVPVIQGAQGIQGIQGIQGPQGDVSTWKANTAYTAAQPVVNPSGDLVTAVAAFTSGASYVAANWARNSVNKGDLAFHVSDYGAVGDGVTDDTSAITNAVAAAAAAGRLLVFNGTKRYRLTGSVTFSGLSLQTNNCTFVKSENNATYYIKIGDNIRADKLKLEIAGGAANDAGIYVNGSNVSIDSVEVTTLTADQVGPNALLVGDLTLTNPAKTNIRIRHIALTGFRSPMRTINIDGCRFSNITISNFSTGVYVIDTRNAVFDKASITGTSPSSNGTAGQNAMLMEAQSADYSCSNVRFEDWLSDGSPEHAFRIGGSFSCLEITFQNCIARNSGNAPGNVATGGAGFKALGNVGHFHRNIHYVNCTAEDGNTSASGINNHSAFNMGMMDTLTLINPTVEARAKTNAAQIGIFLSAVTNVEVISPNVRDVARQAIYLVKDSTDTGLAGVKNVRVAGGRADTVSTSSAALHLDTQESVMQDVFIDGLVCSRGGVAVRAETPTTVGANTGAYTNVHVKIRYVNAPTGSTTPPNSSPGNTFTLDYTGPVYGSFGMASADGGLYLNTTNGQRFIRKTGAWVQQ